MLPAARGAHHWARLCVCQPRCGFRKDRVKKPTRKRGRRHEPGVEEGRAHRDPDGRAAGAEAGDAAPGGGCRDAEHDEAVSERTAPDRAQRDDDDRGRAERCSRRSRAGARERRRGGPAPAGCRAPRTRRARASRARCRRQARRTRARSARARGGRRRARATRRRAAAR